MAGRPRRPFTLTFRALPDELPPAIRIRRWLKVAKALRLRCIRVEPAAAGAAPPAAPRGPDRGTP
jgi:hypothetical protein